MEQAYHYDIRVTCVNFSSSMRVRKALDAIMDLFLDIPFLGRCLLPNELDKERLVNGYCKRFCFLRSQVPEQRAEAPAVHLVGKVGVYISLRRFPCTE